jgi:lipoprotein-releasing system ATP-binding protein
MINSPKLILADEPSGNLDSQNAIDLHHLFFELRKDLGQTFIIVTHNVELAGMADRRIELKDGRIFRG